MTDQGAVPPDFWQTIAKMIDQKVAASQRAASIRNASLSAGGTFTIQGGALVMEQADGRVIFYVGPVQPPRADGNDQPGWEVIRADGTVVLSLFDAIPTDSGGALNQALNWYDRSGNTVLADDTNGAQGLARPWIGGGFNKARFQDFTVGSTSSTFETLWHQRITKQQPRLTVGYLASMDTTATTGETRVLVDGVQLGSTFSETFSVATRYAGPAAIAGAHMADVYVEIQGRRTSGTGTLKVEPLYWKGQQST